MTIEEILVTDHFTALPEAVVTEDELKINESYERIESDEEIERLPNISTLLRPSEFDLGIINDDQATVTTTIPTIEPATAILAELVTAIPDTVPTTVTTTIPIITSVTVIPSTSTPFTQSEKDSADDLPISKYLQKFLQQEDVQEHVTPIPIIISATAIPSTSTPFTQSEDSADHYRNINRNFYSKKNLFKSMLPKYNNYHLKKDQFLTNDPSLKKNQK